ncbi:DNA polymerase-3 subunit epsilon/CBS domain-containing protein [Limimonas halophila]|uniref:DNA polymerase-3 subunit epsilon/CBS domain-containing protein n=1 Tax=Limimonas halophila TaxID=1082479 RepID=A0A1G7LLV4_9PROT|nr:DUF294 nucleotidyltransferase-like domain-containing protein [Limimonas halophila]SDF50366.1 DNA polymerase-3 subunit epsilon/CBS domain-containing protein [Limimonas halophila]
MLQPAASPGAQPDSLTASLTQPPVQSQTKILVHTVRNHMRGKPIVAAADTPVREAVAAMRSQHATSVAVVDDAGAIVGVLTEHDVVHGVTLAMQGGEEPVTAFMSAPVRTVRATARLYTAIGRMRRFGWRHMPVVDDHDRPVGMIRMTDALATAAEQSLDLIERLTHEDTTTGLQATKASQVNVAGSLLADNVPAPDVQALITDINRDLHQRVIDRQLTQMKAEGYGEPPVAFTAIVMGSGGRAESMLNPDQDNGLILDDYPDSEHDRIDGWFRELAERVCTELHEIGFPWCKGYVMMINPLWRKTRSQWRDQVRQWARHSSNNAICMADLFFDFAPVAGREDFAHELRQEVATSLRSNPTFLGQLHVNSGNKRAAVGVLGRFKTTKRDQDGRTALNLKHAGLLPLVQNLRLLSLRDGLTVTGTLARLDALTEVSRISGDEADYLRGAYRHITHLLLRQQIADSRANLDVGYKVPLDALTRREKDILRDSLRAINRLARRVNRDVLRNKL